MVIYLSSTIIAAMIKIRSKHTMLQIETIVLMVKKKLLLYVYWKMVLKYNEYLTQYISVIVT